ncbi:MAG: SusF/SusE family outer membrane protein [Bacteroidales bacterium]|jgi:hypothetical protein|nr:SusF/SusE family outer membrane protein [Bacteroidales bacterium]
MKKIYIILLIIFSLTAIFSCSDNLKEMNKGEEKLILSAKGTDTLAELNAGDSGINFSWTTGSNSGTDAAINYTLQITISGQNFTGAYSVNLGQGTYSMSYTQKELNNILLNELSATPGEKQTFQARITATVANEAVAAQTSDASFATVPYKPVTQTLYITGTSTPGGTDLDGAEEMKLSSTGVFTWTGTLTKGSFKFITAAGQELPSYNRNASKGDNSTLIYRNSENDPDDEFSTDSTNTYTVTADLLNLTMKIKASEVVVAPYDMIYIVGSFTDWKFIEMTPDPVNSCIFRYGAVINWNGGGEFKFGTTSGSWNNMYHPTEPDAPYTWTEVQQDDTGDNKWSIAEDECGKPYKMYLNITPGKEYFHMEEFTPYPGLYLVGDATPNGWSIDEATPMAASGDYTFSWTGILTAGELKITCDKQSDWNGAWFMASEEDKLLVPGTETALFVDKSISSNADIDRKWKVAEAGSYTLTINQLTEQITIEKH